MRLNPALVRCHGPDTRFGMVYQENAGGTRLLGGKWRWCSCRRHPGCMRCSCCDGGNRAASRWMPCVQWPVMGTARNKSLLSLFLCVCGHRVQGVGGGWGKERFLLPPKWKMQISYLRRVYCLRCQTWQNKIQTRMTQEALDGDWDTASLPFQWMGISRGSRQRDISHCFP